MVGVTDSVAVVDSIVKYDSILRFYSGDTRIYDDKLFQDATELDTITMIATKTDLLNIEGGGSTGKFYVLSGNVDDSGFPDAGDTSLTHTNFIGKHLNVFREGQLQQQHANNTTQDGYWLNNLTGEIRFRPALSAGEQLEIWSTNTIQWETLVAEGGGGEAENAMLDSILLYLALDEVSGTTANDAVGTNDGTTSATVNQAGKLGRSFLFDGTKHITVPYNSTLLPADDEFSFSCWFYLSALPSVEGHYYHLLRVRDSDAPYYMASVFIHTTDYIAFYLSNTSGTEYEFETAASAVSAGQWYHLVCVNEGTGVDAKIYLNGVDVTSYSPTAFSGNLLQFNGVVSLGNHSEGSPNGLEGYLDEVAIFDEALTGAQVLELYNSGTGLTYPF